MSDINDIVTRLIQARRLLSKSSMGQVDPNGVQSAKESLAHYTSELNDYIGIKEEQWLVKKGTVFMREINSGASTDAATKRVSGETKEEEAEIAKLKRLVSDAQNRITNSQSLLKRWDNERNGGTQV